MSDNDFLFGMVYSVGSYFLAERRFRRGRIFSWVGVSNGSGDDGANFFLRPRVAF